MVPSIDNFASAFYLIVLVAIAARVVPPTTSHQLWTFATMMRFTKACAGYHIPVDKAVRYPYTRATSPQYGASYLDPRVADLGGPPMYQAPDDWFLIAPAIVCLHCTRGSS
jgi:L-alanine-DL-glutamate epimerase-like enolase superfamily enzyme